MIKEEWIVPFKGYNSSGPYNQNFLWKSGSFYIMDNHRAAMWCWFQHINLDDRYNLFNENMKGRYLMVKLKFKLRNLIYSVGFLFRPITPVAVSFIFLAIASALLVIIIMTLDESTKAYQMLLAILTGVTASLLIQG